MGKYPIKSDFFRGGVGYTTTVIAFSVQIADRIGSHIKCSWGLAEIGYWKSDFRRRRKT